ncbi:MAG: ABC transporter permease subunit [Phycisphaera sp.]|nr:ABC transporter permease subunit [Phycisphaera sp.]
MMDLSDHASRPRLTLSDYAVQTTGVLVAAYRELNARKLFWVALALNAVVIAAMAAVGVDEKGVSLLGFELTIPMVNTTTFPDGQVYKIIFATLGVGLWLSWISTILALLSTASIFPDLASGGVDTMLSKPIGRGRLFLTKFVGGLLFTALQVTTFAVLGFLVIGLRGGAWEWGIFVVVPLMVVFYSYLFSVQALVGMVTKSPVASVIVTLLFWLLVFLVHTGEQFTLVGRTASRLEIEGIEARIAKVEDAERKSTFVARLEEQRAADPNWQLAHNIFYGVKTALPKTTETVALLGRAISLSTDIEVEDEEEQATGRERRGLFRSQFVSERRLEAEMTKALESRSLTWVVGTSVAFELVVLGIGIWYFRRKDF